MGNDLEVLIDNLVKGHLEKKRRKKYGEEGNKLEWYFRECFPKNPPTIRKMELNEEGDILTYHLNVPIPLSFDTIKKLEKDIEFTIKLDCEVLQAKNYEVFVRFYAKKFPTYCAFKEDYFEKAGKGYLPLGMDRKEIVKIKLDDTVHWLLAGTTGAGKSTLGRCIITSILMNVPNVNMYIIDQKRVEFLNIARKYDIPVAYDANTINALLNVLQKESDRRTELILDEDVTDAKDLKNPPPPLVLVIDELAEMNGKTETEKENQDLLDSLTRLSRACNFHIICMTQKPSAKLWDKFSSTREMLTTRICLRVNDSTTSVMVLDSPICSTIAEEHKGRGVIKNSLGNLQMVQFFDLSYEKMKKILYENASKKNNIREEKNPPTDYIDVEGTVIDENNENYISVTGVNNNLINKVNSEKDIANIKYRKEYDNGQRQRKTESTSLRNDTRRKENYVSERKTVQSQKQQKVRKDDGCKDTGNNSTIQITNGKTGIQNFIL